MNIIDPHLHLFNLKQGTYQWLQKNQPPFWPDKTIIHKSFSEQELNLAPLHTLAGFVHIEAGFDNQAPWREIAWLESYCRIPFKSIAAIDITLSPSKFVKLCTKLSQYKSVVGFRHILDQQPNDILSLPQVKNNLAYLAQTKNIFELQMPLQQLDAVKSLINILQKIPELSLVINHAGWPPPLTKEQANIPWKNWQTGLQALANLQQCRIKCSGWEMLNRGINIIWQQKVISECLALFGLNRVMLASNFPVSLLSHSYQETWQTNIKLVSNQQQTLLYDNARHCYGF